MKPMDTTLGLVNIVREYFSLKARISEFLSVSPQLPIIMKIIDTDDTLQQLDLILKEFKESLNAIPVENTKKRRLEKSAEIFDVSQSNTSTPESLQPAKRMRQSLTAPFLKLSASKENLSKSVDKAGTSRVELDYQTCDDTSEKEDDGEQEEDNLSPPRTITSPTNISNPQVPKPNPEVKIRVQTNFPTF